MYRQTIERLRAGWRRVRPFAIAAMTIAVGIAIARYIANHWEQIAQHNWTFHWPWLLSSIVLLLLFLLAIAAIWHSAVRWSGTAVALQDGLWAWSRSSLARYLPTPIWLTASRLYVTTQLGSSLRGATFSYVAELAGSLAGAFAIAILALPVWATVPAALPPLLSIAALLALLPLAWTILLLLLRRARPLPALAAPALLGWSLLCGVAFWLYGLAHLTILYGIGAEHPPVLTLVGVSALAWAAGTLNILSPSGLGTREVVLVYGLQSYLDPTELIALGILSRLAVVLSEMLLFVVLWLLVGQRAQKRNADGRLDGTIQER